MYPATFFTAQSVGCVFELKVKNTPFLATYIGRHHKKGWRFEMENGARMRICDLRKILKKINN